MQHPNNLGYYTAYVSKIDNGTPYPKMSGSNFLENDMFPDIWSKQRIIEELSLAYSNRKPPRYKNQWRGETSDGNMCILCLKSDGTIITAWPVKMF